MRVQHDSPVLDAIDIGPRNQAGPAVAPPDPPSEQHRGTHIGAFESEVRAAPVRREEKADDLRRRHSPTVRYSRTSREAEAYIAHPPDVVAVVLVDGQVEQISQEHGGLRECGR
ncbi:hypothetical protein RDE2_24790 [Rhodococcus sp. RDE2]|nr:hypothetical protein RDE2_24790 [Rhodococcus sp. RDE2]